MPDLPQAVEGQKPRHRPHAEAASAVVDHFHVADRRFHAAPRRASHSGRTKLMWPMIIDEGEIEQTHEERELEVEEHAPPQADKAACSAARSGMGTRSR